MPSVRMSLEDLNRIKGCQVLGKGTMAIQRYQVIIILKFLDLWQKIRRIGELNYIAIF